MGLEQIKVEYVDHMGSDLSTVNSARVSFDKESDYYYAGTDFNGKDTYVLIDKDVKLIKYLADHKHLTPFRHNQIQIRCTAPIFIARQLGKHQAGLSWNEVSRRYVDAPPEFYTPDEWRARPEGSVKQGSGDVHGQNAIIKKMYSKSIKEALLDYNSLVDNNVAPEMARMVLPQSMLTTWIWSGNLLAFVHVYKERIASGAQLEARYFAMKLKEVVEPLFPVSFSALIGE